MARTIANILPPSYYDGLSTLWGGCAYVASAIVAIGLVFQAIRCRPDSTDYMWMFAKVLLIGITTLFLREWLMRLNDVIITFGSVMGVDPRTVDERFVTFISGKIPAESKSSFWDVIWDTGSIGTAFAYAFLWLFGWLSWGLQYIIKLIGGVLLTAGWALSPVFLSFFMLRPMADVARKYLIGLVALVCWPFGWVLAAVVTNAMLEAAAVANLIPVVVPGSPMVAPALTVLLVGSWMIISSILAPYITTRVLLSGVNPAVAFAQGFGGVFQSAFTGGVGGAVAAGTAGAAAPAVIATAALSAMAAGTESAARGGDSARTTSTMGWGLAGLYGARMAGRQATAMEGIAGAQNRRAAAAESFNAQFRERTQQPHHPDPNQAAIEIEAHVKS